MVKAKRQIVLIIYNVRSAYNVGSLLRTADGLGVKQVIIGGYSPYPKQLSDKRLPHLADKTHHQIQKTALGAEISVKWKYVDSIEDCLEQLQSSGFIIAALEQTAEAIKLNQYSPPQKITLFVGNEVGGLEPEVLKRSDVHLQIPMLGVKESFNVAVAGAIALYHLRFS